jgi:hypothetical protein
MYIASTVQSASLWLIGCCAAIFTCFHAIRILLGLSPPLRFLCDLPRNYK